MEAESISDDEMPLQIHCVLRLAIKRPQRRVSRNNSSRLKPFKDLHQHRECVHEQLKLASDVINRGRDKRRLTSGIAGLTASAGEARERTVEAGLRCSVLPCKSWEGDETVVQVTCHHESARCSAAKGSGAAGQTSRSSCVCVCVRVNDGESADRRRHSGPSLAVPHFLP